MCRDTCAVQIKRGFKNWSFTSDFVCINCYNNYEEECDNKTTEGTHEASHKQDSCGTMDWRTKCNLNRYCTNTNSKLYSFHSVFFFSRCQEKTG